MCEQFSIVGGQTRQGVDFSAPMCDLGFPAEECWGYRDNCPANLINCRMCNEPGAEYRVEQKMTLCDQCAEKIPAKLNRSEFNQKFWKDVTNVPRDTMMEYWLDYLESDMDFDTYCEYAVEPRLPQYLAHGRSKPRRLHYYKNYYERG